MTFLPSKIPLVQTPMASAQGPELTIAVCRAGGLGSLPAAMFTPDRLREQIATVKNATSAPFNVNFFCHAETEPDSEIEARWRKRLAPYYVEASIDPSAIPAGPIRAPFDARLCAVIEETRPAVVSFHFGLPPAELLSRVKAAGALILSSATTVAEARWLEQNGVDAIIAQGRRKSATPRACRSWRLAESATGAGLRLRSRSARTQPRLAPPICARRRRRLRRRIAPRSRAQEPTQRGLQTCSPDAPRAVSSIGSWPRSDRCARTHRGSPWRCERRRRCGPWLKSAAAAISPPLWAGEAAALARDEGAEALTRRRWADGLAVMSELSRRAES